MFNSLFFKKHNYELSISALRYLPFQALKTEEMTLEEIKSLFQNLQLSFESDL